MIGVVCGMVSRSPRHYPPECAMRLFSLLSLVLCAVLCSARVAGAQVPTPEGTAVVDLSVDRSTLPFDLGRGVAYEEELDGIAATPEYLQYFVDENQTTWLRGFAIRNGQWCVGPWIVPASYIRWLPGDSLVNIATKTIRGRTKIALIGDRRLYMTIPIPYGCE